MSYAEFCSLLSGIMPDTPLGSVVAIRSENDLEKVHKMTPEQLRIRNEWFMRRSEKRRKNKKAYNEYWLKAQNELRNACLN